MGEVDTRPMSQNTYYSMQHKGAKKNHANITRLSKADKAMMKGIVAQKSNLNIQSPVKKHLLSLSRQSF